MTRPPARAVARRATATAAPWPRATSSSPTTAATPSRRRCLPPSASLARAGIPVGVLAAPLIPVLTDPDLEAILAAAGAAGARVARYQLLRLPLELEELFGEWLERHAPLAARHVWSRIRAVRGGRASDARFGTRMTGEGEYARLIARRFALACRRLGLDGEPAALATDRFRAPARSSRCFRET